MNGVSRVLCPTCMFETRTVAENENTLFDNPDVDGEVMLIPAGQKMHCALKVSSSQVIEGFEDEGGRWHVHVLPME